MRGQIEELDARLLKVLTELEKRMGFELTINSGYREPDHNIKVGGVPHSEHTLKPAKGADVLCLQSTTRYRMLRELYAMGIQRIGIGETFLHVGVSTSHPLDVCWTYYPLRRTPTQEGSKTV